MMKSLGAIEARAVMGACHGRCLVEEGYAQREVKGCTPEEVRGTRRPEPILGLVVTTKR